MKRITVLRTIAAVLVFAILGTTCAFADIIDVPRIGTIQWIIYCIPVIAIIIAITLIRHAIKRRRLKNDGMDPESDINVSG